MKKPEKKPRPAGPAKEQNAEEEARRRARKGVADAFSTDEKANDNTEAAGKTKGNSGNPDGTDSAVDGSGTGSVGGGWIMPKYAKVASALTGRVELRAIVGRDGQVISVEQTGGKAAGSDRRGGALHSRSEATPFHPPRRRSPRPRHGNHNLHLPLRSGGSSNFPLDNKQKSCQNTPWQFAGLRIIS